MKKRSKKQINIKVKIILFILIFVLTYFTGLKLFTSSLKLKQKEKVYFKETGNVSYNVCLDKNDFFDVDCLDANMSYVAGLIKKIHISFNYQFNGNLDDMVSQVEYEIIAKLVIKNSDTGAKYYEKEYILTPKTTDIIGPNTLYNLKKNIDIDYEYYNNIATTFKSKYNVDADSYLVVYFNANKKVNDNYSILPTYGQIALEIPLSKKAIEIKLNTQELNKDINTIIATRCFIVNSYFKLVIAILLLLTSSFFLWLALINIFKYNKKISAYDKLINKILKEYDRLIVETTTFPNIKDYDILMIKNFDELVDVRDNLRLPIMFYRLKNNDVAHFYVLKDNHLYLYTINKKEMVTSKKAKL